MQDWTILQARERHLADLALCTNQQERNMCNALCRKSVKDLAIELRLTRGLNPGEKSIMETYY